MDLAQTIKHVTIKRLSIVLISVLALFFATRINFFIFHAVVEFGCIVLMLSIHVISLNVNEFHKNSNYLQLGMCYGIVASFDIMHTIAYTGFTVFLIDNINLAFQLWIAARFIESFGLFFIFYMAKSKKIVELPVFMYTTASISIIILSLILLKVFPVCYIRGYGLTWFKRISEIIFCIMTWGTLYFFKKDNTTHDTDTYRLFYMYMVARVASGISFAVYFDIFGLINSLGHILKCISYCFLYKAIVEIILKAPYRELKNKRIDMKRMNEALNEEIKKEEAVQHELINQYEFLQKILDSIPSPIFYKSIKGHYDGCNKAFEQCFELRKEEIIGEAIFDIANSQKMTKLLQFDSFIISDMKDPYNEYELEYVDGKNHYVVLNYVVLNKGEIKDKADKANGFVGIMVDITDKKKSEENEKTLKHIREVDVLKTEFFSNISHELRTPLNVLLGALQLMELHLGQSEDSSEIEKLKRYSGMMKQNCFRLLRLVNNLIDITKIDAGYSKLQLENYDIVRIVEDITMSVTEYIHNKNIVLVFNANIEEKIMAVDCDKIERIILNLLSNAVKFTKAGGHIFVNIGATQDKIIISVKDDGVGIPQNKLNEIFERFIQVDDLMTRKREGSGIGLSLVKSMVEMHGGRIYVESEDGKGSEFFIELPIYIVPEVEDLVYDNYHMQTSNIERICIEFSDIYA